MKSTREDQKPEVPKAKYPHLMISRFNKAIVLFTEPRKGTVVNVGTGCEIVGEYDNTWVMSAFSLYTGKVTLNNEKY